MPLRWGGVEGVDQAKRRATFGIDHLPIDQVTAWALRQAAHELGSGMGSGVGGRQETGFTGAVRVEVPGWRGLFEGQGEGTIRCQVMELEVLGSHPWVVPLQVFPFGELSEDPEFGDPIDLTDQGLVVA